MGPINASYVGFDASVPLEDYFDVDMESVKSCKRQTQGKCPNDPHPPHQHVASAPSAPIFQ